MRPRCSGVHRVAHHVCKGVQIELVHKTLAIGVHGARADVHDSVDLLAALSLSDQLDDLGFLVDEEAGALSGC